MLVLPLALGDGSLNEHAGIGFPQRVLRGLMAGRGFSLVGLHGRAPRGLLLRRRALPPLSALLSFSPSC